MLSSKTDGIRKFIGVHQTNQCLLDKPPFTPEGADIWLYVNWWNNIMPVHLNTPLDILEKTECTGALWRGRFLGGSRVSGIQLNFETQCYSKLLFCAWPLTELTQQVCRKLSTIICWHRFYKSDLSHREGNLRMITKKPKLSFSSCGKSQPDDKTHSRN